MGKCGVMRVIGNTGRVDSICTASRVLFVFHENGFDLGSAFRRVESACWMFMACGRYTAVEIHVIVRSNTAAY